MTDTAGPFDGAPWSEAQWARHAATWAPSGVYGSTPAASSSTGDLPLSVSGLSVGLGAGRAWVRGFGFERTGAAVMQAVTANSHASFSRRDRIVLRRNLATHTITAVLLTGTPASSPAAPAISEVEAGSWDLKCFSFLVPPNSGTAITGIVDEREWTDPGGLGRQGKDWTTVSTSTDPNYDYGFTGSRVALTQMTAAPIDIPTGYRLEAKFKAPHVKVNASSTGSLFLMADSTQLDEGVYGTDVGTVFGAPCRLEGTVTGPATGVVLKVEGIGTGAGGFVKGAGIKAPQLQYRLRPS